MRPRSSGSTSAPSGRAGSPRAPTGCASGSDQRPVVAFSARVGTLLVGSVRLWPVRIGETAALLLGPLTVEPAFRERGIGHALIERSLAAAKAAGHRVVVLVGDEPYYGRAGFKPVPPGRIAMPGPVDPARLLVCELVEGAFEGVSGAIASDGSAA